MAAFRKSLSAAKNQAEMEKVVNPVIKPNGITGQTLNVNAHWFVPAVRQAGIKDFRWHDLRHTYASRLRQSGVPLGNVAELLGHKGLKMTQRYAHLAMSNLHDAVSRIQSRTDTSADTRTEEAVAYVH